MMQNRRAVYRRPALRSAASRHSPFALHASPPSRARLLHTFELALLLESHAVQRVATATARDLAACRDVAFELDRALDMRRLAHWPSLEIQLHRALDDQGGNTVLAALAERTLRDGLAACPIPSPSVLSVLHSQHREILRCVDAGDVDAATRQTRVHLLSLRDAVLGAQPAPAPGRIGLPA